MDLKRLFRKRIEKPILKELQNYKSTIDFETELDAVSFSAIDKIASAFASLSIKIFDKRTKQEIKHPLSEVFDQPNLDETHFLFFYNLVKDYFSGNVYLYLYRDEKGNVSNVFRLNPSSVYVSRNEFNQKVFSYFGKNYTASQILHIPSRFGYDGKKSHSIYEECRKIFQTANNLDSYTNNSFNNGFTDKRMIIDISSEYPDASPEEKMKLRQKYINDYGGINNISKPIVKSGKIGFSTIDLGTNTNQSQQLLENRQYQEKVICQVFGIPQDFLNGSGNFDLENTTTLFITNAIKPLCEEFSQAFQKLFRPEEKELYFIEFNLNSILKSSLQSKMDAYQKQISMGVLSVNEVRQKENLSEIEAGNYHFMPSNLIALTEENIKATLAKSKIALAESAGTIPDRGSDKA